MRDINKGLANSYSCRPINLFVNNVMYKPIPCFKVFFAD